MGKRKNLTMILIAVAVVILATVVTVVGVLAATQQTVTSNINITFTAEDIEGSVTVRYKVQEKTLPGVEGGTEAGKVSFKADGSQDGSISIGTASSFVEMSGSTQALYIRYDFTRAEVDYNVSATFTNDDFKVDFYDTSKSDWVELTGTSQVVLANVDATNGSVLIMRLYVKDASKDAEVSADGINIPLVLSAITA